MTPHCFQDTAQTPSLGVPEGQRSDSFSHSFFFFFKPLKKIYSLFLIGG